MCQCHVERPATVCTDVLRPLLTAWNAAGTLTEMSKVALSLGRLLLGNQVIEPTGSATTVAPSLGRDPAVGASSGSTWVSGLPE